MQPSWTTRFHRALVDAVVTNGTIVRTDVDKPPFGFYGWIDMNQQKRSKMVADVGIDYQATTMPHESTWNEFKGTFYEGDTEVVGVDLDVVLKDATVVRYRWAATMSDLIQAVLHENP
jgi:hypothetical protein